MDNEIKQLYNEDQGDRHKLVAKETDWSFVGPRDEQRMQTARDIVEKGILDISGEDLWRLSFIFQHGPMADDTLIANNLAKESLKKGYTNALWMVCATWDRYMWRTQKFQVYGTQYRFDENGNKVYKPINKDITNDELISMGLPTREEFQDTLPKK